MPDVPTFPGVHIREIESGVRTIAGVATSITAFIGRTARGPANDPIRINSFADFERAFGGLSLLSSLSYAVFDFYANGGRRAIIVRVHNGATPATITLPPDLTASPPPSGSDALVLRAANEGAWGAGLSALVDHQTRDPNDRHLFNLTVTDSAGGAPERFLNLSVDPQAARYVGRVLAQGSRLVRLATDSGGNDRVSEVRPARTVTPGSPPASPPGERPDPVPAVGGGDGGPIGQAQIIGPGMQSAKEGLYALEKADLFNILYIPPFTLDQDITAPLVGEAASYCERRRAFLIVDAPRAWGTTATAVGGALDLDASVGTRSNHAAIYFPRVRKPNPLRESQVEEFGAGGAVAGAYARTDSERGVWKAPAGQDARLQGVPQLSVPLTDDENGELNPLGVNCLRSFPVFGRLVWGARTLEGADQLASEWKYVPVRRLALFIEESLYRGTQWVVFEPNDEPLWAQIRLNVGAFMQNLFRQGAFQGTSPNDAYFVRCDSTTTTQTDIDLGIVNILVGFAPLKPAEFVIITIQQKAGQAQA